MQRQESPLSTAGAAPVCSRCAAHGRTCCEPDEGVSLAPLTPGDLWRITAATGLLPAAFSVTRGIDSVEAEAIVEQDPVLKNLVRDRHLVSLAKRGSACVFHEPGRGCTLAYDVRPVLCRRFPIVRRGRYLSVQPGGECLAVEEARDMPELLALMGLTVGELSRLDRVVREDTRR